MLFSATMKASPIQRAIAHLGGQTELAKVIGVNQGLISQVANGLRPLPPRHAISIERATGGAVSRRELCPEFPWDQAAA